MRLFRTIFIPMILCCFIVVHARCISQDIRRVRAMEMESIDLSRVSDGTFHGEFTYCGFTYKVETSVRKHRIVNINITENRSTRYARKAEGVATKVIKEQRTDVDTKTGATTTSKAILQAIINSLKKGTKQ